QSTSSTDLTIPSFAKFFSVKSIISDKDSGETTVDNNEERNTKTSTVNEKSLDVESQVPGQTSVDVTLTQESDIPAPNVNREENTVSDDTRISREDNMRTDSTTLKSQFDVPSTFEDDQVAASSDFPDLSNVDDKSRPQQDDYPYRVESPKKHLSSCIDQSITEKKKKNTSNEEDKDDVCMIMEAVHRWRDNVSKRDSLIKELQDNLNTLHETVEHQDNSMNTYRERIFILESLIKQQQVSAEWNHERIENIKAKVISLILSHVSRIRFIDNELNPPPLHPSIIHIFINIERDQIAQITELNTKLTSTNTQLGNIITQLRQTVQDSENKAARYALESETTRAKLETLLKEKEAHIEECGKLKLSLECVDEKCRTLTLDKKENEEK
ncbi:9891_t:CDS:2, partial [Acaulospora colombiana]